VIRVGACRVVAVLGVPGSGKSTQARVLAAALGGVARSVGDRVRALAAGGDEDAGETVRTGRAISPEQYRAFLLHVLDERPGVLVLDGSPREELHVDVLAEVLARHRPGSRVGGVLLDLPVDRAAARILGRGSARPDDAEQVVRRRIELQSAALGRLAASFRARWPLTSLDATAAAETVTQQALRSLAGPARCSPPGAGPPS
jgi:adenylate kinase